VIPMLTDFNKVEYIKSVSGRENNRFFKLPPMTPFNDKVLEYFDGLSKLLNKDPQIRDYPDVATFAFFCRKANMNQLKSKFHNEKKIRLGRGLVFHIAPSNIPVNFAYTLLVGLLAGNSNIVRMPSKDFIQVRIIVNAINSLSKVPKYADISDRIIIVKYDRENNEPTKEFSAHCDARIIWGGDDTIQQVRKYDIPAQAFDITFADRYSFSLINADKFFEESNPDTLATKFYNDTYLFDQNACTSPHLVIWLGSRHNVKISQIKFWESLYEQVKNKYNIQPVLAIDKLTSFFSQAIDMNNIKLKHNNDNLLWRVKLNELSKDIDKFSCNGGYFSEYHAQTFAEVAKIIKRKYQTLSYYGFSKNELAHFIKENTPVGIDRIVPIGRTMEFSLIWDGYNMIESLSRCIDII